MSESIRHQGHVKTINGQHVQVAIEKMAACVSCQAAASCHLQGAREKVVDVYHCDVEGLHVGDEVTVVASPQTAIRSLLLCFGYPLLLMLVVLVVMTVTRQSEGVTALTMLGVLIPYYIILWCKRRRIAHRLIFWIEKTNNRT